MTGAWLYALFCLAVVGTFTVARTEGWVLFGTGQAAENGTGGGSGANGSGGRSGTYLGSHK